MKIQNNLFRSVCLTLLVLLFVSSVDLLRNGLHTGGVLAIFSTPWFAGMAVYTVFALILVVVLVWAMIKPDMVRNKVLNRNRRSIRLLEWMGIVLALVLPPILFLGPTGVYLTGFYYRLLALGLSSLGIAALLPTNRYPLWKRVVIGMVLTSGVFGIALRFVPVSDFPFKLSWSEGNRLWDYSLYFIGQNYDLAGRFEYPGYLTPGRHGLWGLPFLIPDVGIAVLRLWDALLWVLPALVLGYALFNSTPKGQHRLGRIFFMLLTFLFISQGPVYAPLLISAVMIAFGVRADRPVHSILLTALSCFYAGASRWTWFVAPALWSGLICLLEGDSPDDQNYWRRLIWPAAYGFSGLAGGLVALAVTGHSLFQSAENSSIAFSQPLLWYRLFPNATYPQGVLPALFIAVGPLAGLLLWALLSKRIRWDWLQLLGVAGVLLSTLIVGIVISVKIGGGSNLHNLDMFLVSLVFTAVSGFRVVIAEKKGHDDLPMLVRVLIGLLVFIPAWGLYNAGAPLQLPDEQAIQLALRDLNDIVYARANEGDVLFLDQRQLLTFGDVENVPLVMEHELKDLTNRAMSGDPALFEDYYEDLEAQRFSLIVTGHLPQDYTAPGHPFGEEDNAQYAFIYAPMFEHYEVVRQFDGMGLWLLQPIEEPGE